MGQRGDDVEAGSGARLLKSGQTRLDGGRLARLRARSAWFLDQLERRIWWTCFAWMGLLAVYVSQGRHAAAWHYFVAGTHTMFSRHGLHLYGLHPELQIGPVTFLVTAPLILSLPVRASQVMGTALLSITGLVVLAQLQHLLPERHRASRHRIFIGALLFLLAWSELAVRYAHIDDVLAILCAVIAVRALRSGRGWQGAVLLALAADCKPWALAFVPLLLVTERREWVKLVVVWTVSIAVVWLPFYLADPRTLSAGQFQIPTMPASSLRILGIHAAATPSWCRPLQVLLGTALGVLAVRRGRWPAVILLVVVARLLFDPATKSYYDAALVAGALLCDLLWLAGPIPWFALSAVGLFYLPSFALPQAPHLYGLLRTGYLLTLVAVVYLCRAGSPQTGAAASTTPTAVATAPKGPRRRKHSPVN